ncbi:Polyketide synthase PksJ [Enhygromyxa salina]|uniref:Polyketide synthase PksJ n=2 Tax=Enhygromyxa salina TaxID=215803 RepID=A0A2S9XCV0_9BACT|nr:Polyketide synthase PksJ [Enhygromyxa salina]
MGTLRTLGEIVEYMRGLMGGDAGASSSAAASAPGVDLEALMLTVVADKTGYPEQMLELSMDMEAELGIDSIKRVEILAAVQEQVPGLPQIDAGHMGTLRTLGEIVEYMRGLMGGDAGASSAAAASAPGVDLEALMLTVVADKTGYPEQMLELSMDMEAELGIDSIKRVEILAAVQEQVPGLPQIDAGHMGTLRTLGEIVEYMRGLMGGDAAGPAASEASAGPRPASVGATPALGRYALELVSAPPVGLAQPGLHGPGGVFVTGAGKALTDALVSELEARGLRARSGDTVPADAPAVVFLGGLREVADEAEAIAINREAFALARTLAPRLTSQGGLFVTVQDTGGGFGLEPCEPARAYLAGLPALIKTAKQEWPSASLSAIDIDRAGRDPAEIAAVIVDELLLGGGELEVALAATGERRTLRSLAAPLDEASEVEAPLAEGDVVVVSGGARGVTAACTIEWARRTRARFALLGRSRLEPEPPCCAGLDEDAKLKRALLDQAQREGEALTPASLARRVKAVVAGREIRATLAAIEAAGGEARYLSVDVNEPAAVAAALAEVRSDWGPIRGLVHGAGVLADKLIAELSDEQFDWAFNTKVEGLRALLSATADDPLRVLCMFSSVSARCGNNGQSAYAMANEVLNKVAQAEARRRPDALVKSLGWGPWQGGMVSPQLEQHFAALGVPMIPLEVGADMLATELSGFEPERVELVLGGEPRPEALLVKGSEARELELEVHLDRRTHAYLADHSIAGVVVVPVVLAMEWFSRMARAFRPDLQLQAITDVRVLRGIKLHGFEGAGDRLTLRCRQLSNGRGVVLELELLGEGGALHYRAKAKMDARGSAPSIESGETPKLALGAWGDASIYGDVLFHGRDFQVIETLDGVGADGISGTLKGVRRAGWTSEPWQVDVAALDGGLQLAVLWARERLGGATLPMGIGELHIGSAPVTEGPVKVVASCRETSAGATVDVMLLDQAGARLSELRGAELVLRPDQPRVTPRARA